jgi:hypothetical protein
LEEREEGRKEGRKGERKAGRYRRRVGNQSGRERRPTASPTWARCAPDSPRKDWFLQPSTAHLCRAHTLFQHRACKVMRTPSPQHTLHTAHRQTVRCLAARFPRRPHTRSIRRRYTHLPRTPRRRYRFCPQRKRPRKVKLPRIPLHTFHRERKPIAARSESA